MKKFAIMKKVVILLGICISIFTLTACEDNYLENILSELGFNTNAEIETEVEVDPTEFVLNTMSFNMKYESQTTVSDPIHTWENRKPGIADCLENYSINIVGTQELQGWQYEELMEELGENWSGVGEPRYTSDSERCLILYRNDLIEYIEGDTIWLSETPEVVGSSSWDSAHPRILTYGKFKHLGSGVEFYYFNTHLDHQSSAARSNQLSMIVDYMNLYSDDYPIVLTGDFNMYITSEDFSSLTDITDIYDNTFTPFWDDFGSDMKTTHGFAGGTSGQAIDFIYYNLSKLVVEETQIIYDLSQDRYYLSDHYPVYSVLKLNI